MVHLVKPVAVHSGLVGLGWLLICELAVFQKTVLVYPVSDILFFLGAAPICCLSFADGGKANPEQGTKQRQSPTLTVVRPSSVSLLATFCTWQGWEQVLGFPRSSVDKILLAMQEIRVRSLGREDPLEKEMTTHSSILAWKIPWTEEPGGLQSMRS